MFFRATILLLILSIATLAHAQPNPELTVQLPGIGSWSFTEAHSEMIAVQVTSGVPIDFTWSAEADSYGGTIVGYRYGWDVADPNNATDPGWASPGFVPDLLAAMPVDFSPGIHSFYVAVVDDAGSMTLAAFLLDVVSPVSNITTSWGAVKSAYIGGIR